MRVRAERIEELLRELDTIADPHIQTVARELIQSVTELHVNGLERVLEIVSESGSAGAGLIDQLGNDDLVGPLMALHGLHPLELSERVSRAVERFGTGAELLSMDGANVRIQLRRQTQGCGSTADTRRVALEDAIYSAAPDLDSLIIEEEEMPASNFIPLEVLHVGSAV
jgi:hypothetical protein